MKKIIKQSILCLATIMSLASCEDRIQIEMDEKARTLTVDAFLNNLRQNQIVRLTYTDGYFSGKTPPALMGASVRVKDISLNKIYDFTDNSDGSYSYNLSVTDTIIYTNHTYELLIKYGRYEYSAISTCERTTKIDSLYFEYKAADNNPGGNLKAGNKLQLNATDAAGPIPDFYWIKLYKNGKFYGRPENIQLGYFGDHNEFDGFYFLENVWVTSGPDGSSDTCITGDKIRLEICGISNQTYDFLNLGKQMSNNTGLFATTPVNLPTNVFPLDKSYPKAVGFFSIGDVNFKEVVYP